MTTTADRAVVETPQGTFPIVNYTGQVTPIYYAADSGVLLKGGHWNIELLESVIGQPRDYRSRTVRLYAVLPELTITELRIRELMDMLKVYATRRKNDLNVKLTYYPTTNGQPAKERFNARDYDETQQRLSIDVFGKEIIDYLARRGPVVHQLLWDMHIKPDPYCKLPSDPLDMDIDALAKDAHLLYPLNTEYDYTALDVHHSEDGKPQRRRYMLSVPSYQVM